jgi:hypothetical protein
MFDRIARHQHDCVGDLYFCLHRFKKSRALIARLLMIEFHVEIQMQMNVIRVTSWSVYIVMN